jgi:VanZ family protein
VKRFLRYLPAIITAGIIFILSGIPGETVIQAGLGKEKYHINGHFIAYMVLCVTLFKASGKKWAAFAISVIYGILMEFYQKLIPGRAFQYFDILVNIFGSLLGLVILWKRSLFPWKKLKNWLNN